jgi:hypothetical protein
MAPGSGKASVRHYTQEYLRKGAPAPDRGCMYVAFFPFLGDRVGDPPEYFKRSEIGVQGTKLYQMMMSWCGRLVRLAYQPPASSTFLSKQISHQQPASSTSLSEQISTNHQSPAKRTGWCKLTLTFCEKKWIPTTNVYKNLAWWYTIMDVQQNAELYNKRKEGFISTHCSALQFSCYALSLFLTKRWNLLISPIPSYMI